MPLSNKHNIGLSVAAFLALDNYDYDKRSDHISTTTLIRSTKQVALSLQPSDINDRRIRALDVTDLVASTTGSAVHDALERTWLNGGYKKSMKVLGYAQDDIDSVVVNPKHEKKGMIPVYVEKRGKIAVGDWYVTGMFDFVGQGKVEDLKNTIEFIVKKAIAEKPKMAQIMRSPLSAWDKLQSVERSCPKLFDYMMQGSIYRMIHHVITKDYMTIQFMIKDFKKYNRNKDGFPNVNPYGIDLPLFDRDSTMQYILHKLDQLDTALMQNQEAMIPCNDNELWRGEAVWKYFKNPDAKKATKVFGAGTEAAYKAHAHCSEMGIGIVKEFKQSPTACVYCVNNKFCLQCRDYVLKGELFLDE